MSEQNNVRILSGEYELILAKNIIMDSLESELVIDLSVGNVHMGNMRIRFLTAEGEEISLKSQGENGELILECMNFDRKAEIGTLEMLSLGRVEGKELKMHLWTKMLGSRKVRQIDICLYREQ